MVDQKRVVIVSASMGGGHLQISRELQRRLRARGHAVEVVDVLRLMPSGTGTLLGASYPWLVKHAPQLYQKVYDVFFLGEQSTGQRVGVPVRLMLPGLLSFLRSASPDLVLSTYPLCTVALGHLKARGDLSCPAVTVVTTFSLNRLWTHPAIDLEVCISADAARAAERLSGRPAAVCGPVVRPEFHSATGSVDKGESDHRRQWRALVSTGSIGLAGSAVDAARVIAALPGWEATVLCGRNGRLRRALAGQPDVRPLDWVEDMAALMRSADVLVDNAGGMTAKEAITAGLPVVTFRPLTGHGRDDARAMARLGLTDVASSPEELRRALLALTDPRVRRRRIDAGHALLVDDPLEPLERAWSADGPHRASTEALRR